MTVAIIVMGRRLRSQRLPELPLLLPGRPSQV
jgi:hypothetical protein